MDGVLGTVMTSRVDGRIMIELVDGPILMEPMRTFVGRDVTCGGLVTFEGVTRLESDSTHGPLNHLFYEAYPEMAVEKMYELAAAALARWGLGRAAIVHRLGRVDPGLTSVCIMVAAGHRAQAFDACRWLIDTLKRDVPIWKKDVYTDGFHRWVDPPAAR